MIRTIGISKYILLAMLLLFTSFSTAGTDLHWLWDDRCAECSNCHDSASQFNRDSIIVKNGDLVSRESGESVREFMQTHRRLKQDDIEFFMNLLARVAGEVNLK